MKQRLLFVFLVMAMLVAGFQVPQAPPAEATHGNVKCTPETRVAYHETGAGNRYELYGHLCLEHVSFSTYRPRVHWHCKRNGVAYDGCRTAFELQIEDFLYASWNTAGRYDTYGSPGGSYDPCTGEGWFADSTTTVGYEVPTLSGDTIRAAVNDPDSVRFRFPDCSNKLFNISDFHTEAHQVP